MGYGQIIIISTFSVSLELWSYDIKYCLHSTARYHHSMEVGAISTARRLEPRYGDERIPYVL